MKNKKYIIIILVVLFINTIKEIYRFNYIHEHLPLANLIYPKFKIIDFIIGNTMGMLAVISIFYIPYIVIKKELWRF